MDNLLNMLFKAVSVEPRYHEDRCLAAGQVVACTACQDACPHRAIRVGKTVAIDDALCTGCGLCVQACPSQALEPKVNLRAGMPLRCSKVRGEAQSVVCLARLRPTDLLRLASRDGKVHLARGDCMNCPIGGARVLQEFEKVEAEAVQLAELDERTLFVEIVETERFDQSTNADAVSRRDLLRGGWKNFQLGTADALAALDSSDDSDDLPEEASGKLAYLRAVEPEPEQAVPWSLPRVAEGCIMCSACTDVCPTDAFSRDFTPIQGGQGAELRLDPTKCIGCGACVDACPVNVIRMDEEIYWEELSRGSQVAYRRQPGRGL